MENKATAIGGPYANQVLAWAGNAFTFGVRANTGNGVEWKTYHLREFQTPSGDRRSFWIYDAMTDDQAYPMIKSVIAREKV